MTGKVSTVKNVLIKGHIDGKNPSISRNFALPFAPRLMEVTHFSYLGGVGSELDETIIILTTSLVQDALLTLPLISSPNGKMKSDCKGYHEMFNLSPSEQVQGMYSFTFNSISGNGLPSSAEIMFTLNLRFTR